MDCICTGKGKQENSGFLLEEILIAFATGGAGNVAQATNLAMQSFSQTLKGAGKFANKGAMELANTMENFLELFSQLRKHSKNLKSIWMNLINRQSPFE